MDYLLGFWSLRLRILRQRLWRDNLDEKAAAVANHGRAEPVATQGACYGAIQSNHALLAIAKPDYPLTRWA